MAYNDTELAGTYYAAVRIPPLPIDCAKYIGETDKNDDPDVFKGLTFETDPHITICTGLPANGPVLRTSDGGHAVLTAQGADLCMKFGPPALCFTGVGFFACDKEYGTPKKHHTFDVVYAKIAQKESSNSLFAMHKALSQLAGLPETMNAHPPHATLAYVRAGRGAAIAAAMNVDWPHLVPAVTASALIFKKFRDRAAPEIRISYGV